MEFSKIVGVAANAELVQRALEFLQKDEGIPQRVQIEEISFSILSKAARAQVIAALQTELQMSMALIEQLSTKETNASR